MEYNNNNNFKYLKKPVLILTLTVLTFILAIVLGISKINFLFKSIEENNKIKNILIQKINILSNVSNVISSGVGYVDIALPSKNASLYGINQVKAGAQEYSLQIENLSVSKSVDEKNGIEKTSVIFDLLGDENNVYSFLKTFNKLLPLSKLEKYYLINNTNSSVVTITLSFYSAKDLEKISAVAGEVGDLTDQEINLLKSLLDYKLPAFSLPTTTEIPAREDIFN